MEIEKEEEVLQENNISKIQICQHNIVRDYVDITPERSQIIFYCTKCLTSF